MGGRKGVREERRREDRMEGKTDTTEGEREGCEGKKTEFFKFLQIMRQCGIALQFISGS